MGTKMKGLSQANGFNGIWHTKEGKAFYTIGAIARRCGKTIEWIRKMHNLGLLPAAIAKDRRGWRLYTENQGYWMMRAMLTIKGKPRRDALIKAFFNIVKHWEDDYEEYAEYKRTGFFSPSDGDTY